MWRYLLFSFLLLFSISQAFAADGCDKTFQGDLRYGWAYTFGDSWDNDSMQVGISSFHYTFDSTAVYSSDQVPGFGWTPDIASRGYIVQPYENLPTGVPIIRANGTYGITHVPASGHSDYGDITITYTISYFEHNGAWQGPKSHKECALYRITWCGDGVVQASDGETCDLGAQNGQPWTGCSATCEKISGGGGGGWGGGGGGGSCTPWSFVKPLSGAITSSYPGLCPVGQVVSNFSAVASGGGATTYIWSCNGSSAGGACTASYGGGGWGGGWGGGNLGSHPGGGGGSCGDGVIQAGEECDTGPSSGPNGNGHDGCRSCKMGGVSTPGSNPGTMLIHSPLPGSIPWGGSSLPGGASSAPGGGWSDLSTYRVIVGHNVPVFAPTSEIVYSASIPFQFVNKSVCLNNTDQVVAGTPGQICRTVTMSSPSASVHLFYGSDLPQFRGNIDTFTGPYQDVATDTTPSFYARLGNYTQPIHVRVARPAIGNTSGGSAYFSAPSGYDVDTIVAGFLDDLRSGNFTTPALRSDDLGTGRNISSSTASAEVGTDTQTRIASGDSTESSLLDRSSTGSVGSASSLTVETVSDLDTLPQIGDTTGAQILSQGDIHITSPLTLSGRRTIIIAQGDLVIDADMQYDSTASWAWIVQHGHIIVKSTVQNIAGVFVVMDGTIQSDAIRTLNQLHVDGTLYGDTSDLVDHRTYIRGETGYQALSIGVIIDYSTRAIRDIPPLLQHFLDQFSVQRVAK